MAPDDARDPVLHGLNPEQREAVLHQGSPLLVLAGAGSGKMRVLARRTARLLLGGAEPASVLALTFTNKAARELRERVLQDVAAAGGDAKVQGFFAGTFHAWGLRLLRRHGAGEGRSSDFAVLDRADQLAFVREAARSLDLPEDRFPPARLLSRLSRAKNGGREPGDSALADVARDYAERLRRAGAVDFDDLLLLPLARLREDAELRARVRPRHVLVDEFQDTNPAQAALLDQLWPQTGDVCVVGDEDQSIYGFRGASLDVILRFAETHAGTKVVRLERNYRSTAPILAAAAAVVQNNRARLGKTLVAERPGGERVTVVRAPTAELEAEAVVERAMVLAARYTPAEVGILYRTNAQSRAIEEVLVRRSVPYVLLKGQRFYERREVKDVLAYVRLVARPDDDAAFERVVNVPARGIGPALLDEIAEEATRAGGSRFQAAAAVAASGSVAGRRVRPFLDLVTRLRTRVAEMAPGALVRAIVKETGYERLLARAAAEGALRAENVDELAAKADTFGDTKGIEALQVFLDDVSISSEPDREEGSSGISLLTLHNAKGLELRGVLIAGLEEGLLPHGGGADPDEPEDDDVEEERRLLYVGMTRARDELVLLHAWQRRIHGVLRSALPSRFLDELPRELVRFEGHSASGAGPAAAFPVPSVATDERGRPGELPARAPGLASSAASRSQEPNRGTRPTHAPASRPAIPAARPAAPAPARPATPAAAAPPFPVGGWVRHPGYGEGLVVEREGSGEQLKVMVRFSSGLRKKFHARFAGLVEVKRKLPA